MRRFRLMRTEDVSGVSGTGVVAEGVVFSSGKVALSWCSEFHTVTVYDSVDDLEHVHGHEGRTAIEWLDPLDREQPAPATRRAARGPRPVSSAGQPARRRQRSNVTGM